MGDLSPCTVITDCTFIRDVRVLYFSVQSLSFQATKDEAPILVCAPHSTFVDGIAILMSHSVPLTKKGVSEVTFIGAVAQFLQVLFVVREEAKSRKNAISQIKVN